MAAEKSRVGWGGVSCGQKHSSALPLSMCYPGPLEGGWQGSPGGMATLLTILSREALPLVLTTVGVKETEPHTLNPHLPRHRQQGTRAGSAAGSSGSGSKTAWVHP